MSDTIVYMRSAEHTQTTQTSCLAGELLCHHSRTCVPDAHFTIANDSSSGQGSATNHKVERGTPGEEISVSARVSSGAVSEDNFPKIGEGSSWCPLDHPLSTDTLRIRVRVWRVKRRRVI
jgi:hypothetical protein